MPRSKRWLALLAVGLVPLVVLALPHRIDLYDEGIQLTGALLVAAGEVPHRDFYANYGPAQFYLLAALIRLFGAKYLLLRVLDAVIRVLTAGSAALLARTLGVAAGPAFAAGAGSLIFLTAYGQPGYPVIPAAGLAMASVALTARQRPFAAGVVAAIAGLFRYDIAAALLVAYIVCMVLASGGLRMVAAFVAGFGVVAGAYALVMLPLGAWPGFHFDSFDYPVHVYAAARHLPPPGAALIAADPGAALYYVPWLVLCAAAWKAWSWRRHTGRLLALAVTAIFCAKAVIRADIWQINGAFAPASVLAALLWQESAPSRRRWLAGAAALGLLAPIVMVAGRLAAPGLPVLPQDLRAAAHLVDAQCPAGARIYVGQTQHRRIFANDVAFYFFAQRLPATHWYHFDPGLQNSAAVQEAMIAEYTASPPCMIVEDDVFANVVEPNDSARDSGEVALDNWIASHYQPAGTFGGIVVLAAREASPSGPRHGLP